MYEKQKAYVEQMEATLKKWSAKVDELKARAEKAEARSKIEHYDQIEDLRIKERGVRAKLNALKNAGADAWESLKDGVEAAMEDLRKGSS